MRTTQTQIAPSSQKQTACPLKEGITLPVVDSQKCLCGKVNSRHKLKRSVVGIRFDEIGLPVLRVRCSCGKVADWEMKYTN